jgi:hypothetical protein
MHMSPMVYQGRRKGDLVITFNQKTSVFPGKPGDPRPERRVKR